MNNSKNLWLFALVTFAFATPIQSFSAQVGSNLKQIKWTLPDSIQGSNLVKIALPKEAYFLTKPLLSTSLETTDEYGQNLAFKLKKAQRQNINSPQWIKSAHIQEDETFIDSSPQKIIQSNVFIEVSNTQKIQLKSKSSTLENPPKNTQSYLLDLRARPSQKLRINWSNTQNFISKIKIETSTDLSHWKTTQPHQSISQINQENFKVHNNTINIPYKKAFIRITLLQAKGNPNIESFETLKQLKNNSHIHNTLKTTLAKSNSDTISFSTKGNPHLESMNLKLNQGQWLKYKLQNSNNSKSYWKTLSQGTLYHLNESEISLIQNSIQIHSSARQPHWKLIIESKSDNTYPEISYSWTPDTLLVAIEKSKEVRLNIYEETPKNMKRKSWPNLPIKPILISITPSHQLIQSQVSIADNSSPNSIYWALLSLFFGVLIFITYKTWKEFKKQTPN